MIRRIRRIATTGLLVVTCVSAQRAVPRGVIHGGGARTFGSPSGFGNVVFPGTGGPPPARTATPLHPGFRNGHGVGRGRSAAFIPYAVPVYVGGWNDYYYQPQQPVVAPAPAAPAPQPVIINNYYSPQTPQPVMRDYSVTPLPEATPRMQTRPSVTEEKATIYLIALKDGAIQAAYGYWLEKDTLHYITPQGSHNRVSFELVNVSFSEQLNRERNVEFKIE